MILFVIVYQSPQGLLYKRRIDGYLFYIRQYLIDAQLVVIQQILRNGCLSQLVGCIGVMIRLVDIPDLIRCRADSHVYVRISLAQPLEIGADL